MSSEAPQKPAISQEDIENAEKYKTEANEYFKSECNCN